MFTINRARKRVSVVLVAILAVAGCGGGGSGGGLTGGLSATTVITNDPAASQQVAWVTLVNVLSMVILGDSDLLGGVPLAAASINQPPELDPDLALQTVTLWLSGQPLAEMLAAPANGGFQAQAVLPPTTDPCNNPGGTVTISGQVLNLSQITGLGVVAVGDYIDSTFSNCEIETGVFVNGDFRIRVDSFSFTPGNSPDILDFLLEMELGPSAFNQMGFTLDFQQLNVSVGSASIDYDGDLQTDKDWRSDPSFDVLALELGSMDLSLLIDDGLAMPDSVQSFRLRNYDGMFDIDKRPLFTVYVADGSGFFETSDFTGRVRFDILTPFGWEGEFGVTGTVWPTEGIMDIFGATDASIRVTANPDMMSPYTDVLIEADVDADGMIVAPNPDLSVTTTWDVLSTP